MTRRSWPRGRGGADRILVLNAGSSTLKASLLRGHDMVALGATTLEWGGASVERAPPVVEAVLDDLGVADGSTLVGIGHRIVHGGPDFVVPTLVDADVLARLQDVVALAPLHLPPALAVIKAVSRRLPGVRQVACFDTAFHARLPETARRYPVPAAWMDDFGIRRYGFHGLSVDWATGRAAELLGLPRGRARLVVAHLGAGASVTAVDRGRSVDTSMGYTPLEGLMMATRSGSIDPGIVVALARDGRRSLDELDDDLLHRSGLLGVGGSADMRTLLSRAQDGDADARLAIEMFVDRAAAAIAGAATRLPRLDAVVFTGGIGEGAATVRAAIVRRLGSLGIAPIAARKRRGDVVLSAPGVGPAVVRVEAREDLVIARAVGLLGGWCETIHLSRAIGHPGRHCRQISRLSATRPV